MTTSITRVSTWLNGKWVGQDSFGNDYYQQKRPSKHRKIKRWVIYAKHHEDASYVAPNWHRWLHHGTDELPKNNDASYRWEQAPMPNMTGTSQATYPKGLTGKKTIEPDYQPWQPPAHSTKFKGH